MSTTAPSSDLIGQRTIRIEHRDQLKQLGINPYPATSKKDCANNVILTEFSSYEGKELSLTGRLMGKREHGKLIFGDIVDGTGSVQIAIKQDELQADLSQGFLGWSELKCIDLGDFVEVFGKIGKTQQGEITIFVKTFKLLSKSLRPFPHSFDEKELQFRRRYIDLVVNTDRKSRFERKALFWKASRDFMEKNGFIEVETPVLEHVTGGADARPFITHHNTLDQEFYLRISTELYQKRLIGGGFEKIYTIGPNFRNEGSSDEHLQEFYQLEWYWAYADYRDNMKLVTDLFRHLAQTIYGKTTFTTRGHTFDLAQEWKEVDYIQVIKEQLGIDIFADTDDAMLAKLKEKGVELSGAINRNRLIDNLWKVIRKDISGPAFLVNEPAFMSPLAKAKTDDPRLTERYHVILAGSELGNGYSEINDPEYQLAQFLDQQKMRDTGDDEAQMLDIDYVEMLEFGMPPVSGHGHSERLFWFFEDITGREGTLFPQLRHEVEKLTKEIYKDKITFSQQSDSSFISKISLDANVISNLPKSTICTIDPQVTEKIEGIKTAFLTLENVSVQKMNEGLEKMKHAVLDQVKAKYSNPGEIKQSPHISGFRDVYKSFGVDPNSRLNSSEAVIRRIIQGKGLYTVNSVVDAYNIGSAYFEIPMAAYDLDKVSGEIKLRFAQSGETITKIGDEQPTEIAQGELIYSDTNGPLCLDFNYRDADRSKITETTQRIILFADGHKDLSEQDLNEALAFVGGLLMKYSSATLIERGFIS